MNTNRTILQRLIAGDYSIKCNNFPLGYASDYDRLYAGDPNDPPRMLCSFKASQKGLDNLRAWCRRHDAKDAKRFPIRRQRKLLENLI